MLSSNIVSTVPLDGGALASTAQIPSLYDLVEYIKNWVLIEVIDNGNGTWTASGPDEYVNLTGPTTFENDIEQRNIYQ